ncbi:MAG: hypothetical protein F4X41_01860 [Chloroflexi bacterium]|nr:hypothetical protein [Chloroflexota bacterium]
MGILTGGMEDHADVIGGPGSREFSREFGDFALNFQVIAGARFRPTRRHAHRPALHLVIEVRQVDIEIPYLQRDIHIRGDYLALAAEPESTIP